MDIKNATRVSEADAQEALDRYADQLMGYPNVNAVGIQDAVLPDGTVEPHVQVYVTRKLAPEAIDPSARIPEHLDLPTEGPPREVKVRVQQIGTLLPG